MGLSRLFNPVAVAWQALAKWVVRLVAVQQRAFAGEGKWKQLREIRKQAQFLAKAAAETAEGPVLIFDHLGAEVAAKLEGPPDGADALVAAPPGASRFDGPICGPAV